MPTSLSSTKLTCFLAVLLNVFQFVNFQLRVFLGVSQGFWEYQPYVEATIILNNPVLINGTLEGVMSAAVLGNSNIILAFRQFLIFLGVGHLGQLFFFLWGVETGGFKSDNRTALRKEPRSVLQIPFKGSLSFRAVKANDLCKLGDKSNPVIPVTSNSTFSVNSKVRWDWWPCCLPLNSVHLYHFLVFQYCSLHLL